MARCAVCNTAVARRVGLVRCGRCHVLYHPWCWRYVRRCAIYGCGWSDRPRFFMMMDAASMRARARRAWWDRAVALLVVTADTTALLSVFS